MGVLLFTVVFWNTHISTSNDQNILNTLQTAQALENAGEWIQAKRIYESLLSQSPNHPQVFSRVLDCCLKLRQYEEALSLVELRLQQEKTNAYLTAMRGRLLFKMGHELEGFREWNNLLASNRMDDTIYCIVADAMIQEQLFDEAIGVYQRGRKNLGDRDSFTVNLADLYETKMEYGKAAEEWLHYLDGHPGQSDIVQNRFARFPKTEPAVKEVVDLFQIIVKRHPDRVDVLNLVMQYFLQVDRYQEALAIAKELEKKSDPKKRGFILMQYADQALQSGYAKQARQAYEIILKEYPDFSGKNAIALGLARCYRSEKKYQDAIFYYDKVIESKSLNTSVMQSLFEKGCIMRDSLNDWNGALAAFQSLVAAFPSAPQRNVWMLEIGDCELSLGDLGKAEILFRQALQEEQKKTEGNWLPTLVLLATTLYYEGRFQNSLELLDTLVVENLNSKLYQDLLLNNALDLRLFLKEFADRFPDGVRLYARAESLQRQSRLKEAVVALDSLLDGFSSNPIAPQCYLKKAELMDQMVRYDESKSDLNTFLRLYPNYVEADRAALMLGKLYEKMGQYAEALNQYDRIIIQYPNSLAAEEARTKIQGVQKKSEK
jgi:tetratricopeptide (TPR) repeat protein